MIGFVYEPEIRGIKGLLTIIKLDITKNVKEGSEIVEVGS